MSLWFYFAVLFLLQFLLFLIHASYEKKLADVPRILMWSMTGGIVLGPTLDLFFGKYLGLCSYAPGFGMPFLLLNGALLYGLFVANILLMQEARLVHFCVWITIVIACFEVPNFFLHLWTYAFAVPSVEYFAFAFGGPLAVALAIATVSQVLLGYRFVLLD